MAKIIKLILTTDRRGTGKSDDDPIRLIHQLWTPGGKLVAEGQDMENHPWFAPERLDF